MSELRDPDQVMRLARMGASHPTRLSFMRVLLRGLRRGGWRIDRTEWDVDAAGVGHAVYRARGRGRPTALSPSPMTCPITCAPTV
jgi:DNA-binding IclR family transcriptional regulator